MPLARKIQGAKAMRDVSLINFCGRIYLLYYVQAGKSLWVFDWRLQVFERSGSRLRGCSASRRGEAEKAPLG